jgi:signal transduction histidine kinase
MPLKKRKNNTRAGEVRTLRNIIDAQERIADVQHRRQDAMDTICQEAMEITQAEGAAVEIAEQHMMVYRAVAGSAKPSLGIGIKQLESLTGMAFRTGKILVCEDSETDPRVDRDACRKVGLRSMVVVPLVVRDRRLGVLKVLSSQPGRFHEADAHILRLMAGFLSAAMAHAEDYSKLENERRLREAFVLALTHDLRNPLSAARAAAQLLNRNIERVDQMIQNLLDANRISVNKALPLQLGECDLPSMVGSTLEEIGRGRVVFMNTSGQSLKGLWDCDAIRRMLENLVDNAFKYGDSHSPITVSIGASEDGETVVLSVHNEGSVIQLEQRKQLFRRFEQIELAQSSGKRGWGLGLFVVRGLAEAHGGEVVLESEQGKGTTFVIRLPWRRVRAEAEGEKKRAG